MKIVAIGRTKNEADIVEAWARHTLSFVDELVICDDNSSDGTASILIRLAEEDSRLTFLYESTIGYPQAERLTEIAREAAGRADWVIPLDADEFLQGNLRKTLSELSLGVVVACVPWRTYVYDHESAGGVLNPVQRMPFRLTLEATQFTKVLVRGAFLRKREGGFSKGSHAYELSGTRMEGSTLPEVCLAHFPVRSLDQWKLKSAIQYLQNSCDPDWNESDCLQTIATFRQMTWDGVMEDTLRTVSRSYGSDRIAQGAVFDPLDYRGGDLKYTEHKQRLVPALLSYASTLAYEIARRRKTEVSK